MSTELQKLSPTAKHPHYYGTLIRKHLFFAALLILVAVFLDNELRSAYLSYGLIAVIGLIIIAGLTSRSNRSIVFIDAMVSALMFLVFEYFAIDTFIQYENFSNGIFLLRQFIAIVFLITMYYSIKTLRYHVTAVDKKFN